jgi:hypothetical protein
MKKNLTALIRIPEVPEIPEKLVWCRVKLLNGCVFKHRA